jgi:alpha-1,2-mannosyltransferase
MAIARVSWMVLGGVNAVLCGIALRPLCETAAVISAMLYAVFFPAIYVEHTALLEPPLTALMLAALVITRALGDGDGIDSRHSVLAGLLLGVAPAVKLWGVVTVLVIAVGLAYRRGVRHGLTVLLSAIATGTVISLPFFLSAPAAMWQMLVVDQLGRRRVAYDGVRRVDDVLGLMLWTQPPAFI